LVRRFAQGDGVDLYSADTTPGALELTPAIHNQIAFRTLEAYHSRHGGPAMKTSGPFHNDLLKLAAIAFLATSAFAQAPPKYDPATEGKFKGVVEELRFVPPTGGKPIAHLVMKSGTDAVDVFLCPKKFLDEMGVEFKANDEIEVTGSKIKQDGTDLTLAREVVRGGDTLTLRFKDGKPAW
jgi:hypothetical protein